MANINIYNVRKVKIYCILTFLPLNRYHSEINDVGKPKAIYITNSDLFRHTIVII